MIALIDNYDSFTYNLYQALAALGPEIQVIRNDQVSCESILSWKPSHIVLSPGPKRPENSGICLKLIQKAAGRIPLLGVCLGHQAIAQAFGGKVVSAKQIIHGKTSIISHNKGHLFKGISNPFEATRYHSLAVSREGFPSCLEITANSEEGEIMGLSHKKFPIFGVQFHPESILTKAGPRLIQNFIELAPLRSAH